MVTLHSALHQIISYLNSMQTLFVV